DQATRAVASRRAHQQRETGVPQAGNDSVAEPASDLHLRLGGEDLTPDPLGYLDGGFILPDEAVEVESGRTNEGGDIRAAGSAYHHLGLIGVPLARQFQRHQGAHLEGGTGDAATSKHETYSTHRF